VERAQDDEEVYLINNEEGRRAAENILAGETDLEGVISEGNLEYGERPSNIFALYENNIGLLTPLIADELKEAEKSYPSDWIEDAFSEAVELNRRSWRYIARILERWEREGRGDATNRRHTKGNDPDRYLRGRYGHLIRR
jgi:DnaD/phage-associated family protein